MGTLRCLLLLLLEGHLGVSCMLFDAKNLSSFNRGASFGNLAKVNFTCCWFFDKWVFFFWHESLFLTLFGLPFLDNAKQSDCLEEKKDFWANFSFKLDVQQYHLASNSFIFSPRIRQPTRSHLKLAWHDWLKCDQSNNVFFDSSINCDSILTASCYAMIPRLDAYEKKCLRGITLQLAVRRQAANLNPVAHTWISGH